MDAKVTAIPGTTNTKVVRRLMPKMTRREFLSWCRQHPKQLMRELVRVTIGY